MSVKNSLLKDVAGDGGVLRKFISNNFLVLILINSGNVFNYLFYFVLGRTLSPSDYGVFNALNSLLVVLVAPMTVVQLVVARFSTQLTDRTLAAFAQKLTKWLLVFILAIMVIGILSVPQVAVFLNVPHKWPIIVMVMVLGGTLGLSIPLGLLQGLRRFRLYGILNLCLSVLRLALTLALVWWIGLGLNGVVSSVFLAVLITLLIGYYFLKDVFLIRGGELPKALPRDLFKYSIPTLVSSTIVIGFLNLDIVLVRHYCTPEASGIYASAAVIGHIAYLLPSVLVTVMFPEVAHSQRQGENSRKVFFVSFLMTALLSGGVTLVCTICPELILTMTYGEKYRAAAQLLPIVSLAMTSLVLANVFVAYGMAQADFKFLWGLGGGMVMFFCLVFFRHESPEQIATALLFSSFALLITGVLWRSRQILAVIRSLF